MKGLLTATPHTDEPVVGEVLPFPVSLLEIRDEPDMDGIGIYIDVDLYADWVRVAIEDGCEFAAVSLTPSQAHRLHEALGVALYGR